MNDHDNCLTLRELADDLTDANAHLGTAEDLTAALIRDATPETAHLTPKLLALVEDVRALRRRFAEELARVHDR